jgi:3-oxoacyl-[acyl-carrier protein] reductase
MVGTTNSAQPVALITGVSREAGIGHAVARALGVDGYRVAAAGWRPYDDRMPWGADPVAPDAGGDFYEVDFEDPDAAASLLPRVCAELGPASVLVLAHGESVDSTIADTTVESFDRHMAVNARASWQFDQGIRRTLLR